MARRTLKVRVLQSLLRLLQRDIKFDDAAREVLDYYRRSHPQVTDRWILHLWNELRDAIED